MGNPVEDYVSISFKSKNVTIQNIDAIEFSLFCNDSLLTIIRDTTYKDWTLGFGLYNWTAGGGGLVWFKNIQCLR